MLHIDLTKALGKVKPMHAVNNGPVYKFSPDQRITNLDDFIAAGIPYARNHDASLFAAYGGNHTVDVNFIFPNFDADPYDVNSYDFACTDELMRVMELSGAKTFYRLGSRIEHEIKKYNTLPPKDFHKWAVICEHIIRHYTAGWANGFHYEIEYWEIWNEPDLDRDDSKNKRTWGGTMTQFFELYDIAAKHLKKCFPHLKIGGPALVGREEWAEPFLKQLQAPLDFFSWHGYGHTVNDLVSKAYRIRALLDKYGFANTESILNEWNYIEGWQSESFLESIRAIQSLRGAVFNQAVMCACQNAPVDMLMYYDARPCAYNGLWAPYTYDRLKGYYSFVAFNELYKLGTSMSAVSEDHDVYCCAAQNESEAAVLIARYDVGAESGEAKIDCAMIGAEAYHTVELYALDDQHDLSLVCKKSSCSALNFTLKPLSCVLLKLKKEPA